MSLTEKPLCVLMLGTASDPQTASALVARSSGCPYVAAYTSRGTLVMAAYILPETKRWWIEGIRAHPDILDLEQVSLTYIEDSQPSSPWLRGEVRPVLETPPCGTRCDRCPLYQSRCSGCPASRFCLD